MSDIPAAFRRNPTILPLIGDRDVGGARLGTCRALRRGLHAVKKL